MSAKIRRYFLAQDSATQNVCGHVHERLREALACARELGLDEVWSVEQRGPLVVPRASTRIAR
jgi:hypothetical protein